MTNEELNLNEILRVRREKLKALKEAGKNPFDIVKYDVTHHSDEIKNNFEEMEGQFVSVAGRMMSKRDMGKASFTDVQDRNGRIQIYVKTNDIGEENYKEFKTYDIGDIIGVKGTVFKTKMGEISIHAQEITLLTKSLHPLPEKWHGLKDTDIRYRKRYVDLIVNPEVRDTFIKRTKIIQCVRKFFDDRGFLEVDTPVLATIASGAAARPFVTHSNALGIDLYLRIATELYLKRLIVGGFEKVYEMGKDFRNEGISVRHNPEFTMIELYEAYADYNDMMEYCEQCISYCAQEVLGTTKITYQGTEIDLTPPWDRITMIDAVKKYSGVDFREIKTDEAAREIAKKLNVVDELRKDLKYCTWGDILNAVFEAYVEDHLIQPTFIIDYPVEISPLTKAKKDDPSITERFEAFIYGREIANAYSELNDPIVQRERFLQQLQDKEYGDEETYAMDEDFIHSLEVGMPPTGGMGIGIDRVIMFLTDSYSIRDVILFPTMKPLE
ncbi:MAG: lysine--tRNA ligase [Clostridiales bacterium]|nr:lysine--tRNA ligase [Clostridiales bacterium]